MKKTELEQRVAFLEELVATLVRAVDGLPDSDPESDFWDDWASDRWSEETGEKRYDPAVNRLAAFMAQHRPTQTP